MAVTVLALALGSSASCKTKSMQEQYSEVRRACRAGDATRARRMTLEMIEASEKFKRLFQDAAADAGGQGIDYCSPFLLVGVEKRIAKADSPD